jgi:Sulfotransferase domain
VLGSIHEWTAPGTDVGPPSVAELLERVWDYHFGGWQQVFDRERTIDSYRAHVEQVRRECPPERLVEWQVAEGWAPLCAALGVPVPEEPMPHLNSRSR